MDSINPPKRRPGRPKKDDKRPRLSKKWEPVTWKPEYEIIILYSVTGKTMKEIGVLTNYTKEQIWNILHTEKAKEIKIKYVESLKANLLGKYDRFINTTADLAAKRIEQVLMNDELAEAKPFAMFDRAAALLKGVGRLKGEGSQTNVTVNQNNNTLQVGQVKDLNTGVSELRQLLEKKKPVLLESPGYNLDKNQEVFSSATIDGEKVLSNSGRVDAERIDKINQLITMPNAVNVKKYHENTKILDQQKAEFEKLELEKSESKKDGV